MTILIKSKPPLPAMPLFVIAQLGPRKQSAIYWDWAIALSEMGDLLAQRLCNQEISLEGEL